MTRKKKIYIGDHKNMLIKAMGNAGAGAPISMVLNVMFAIPIVVYLHENGVHPLVNAGVLLVPFYWASVVRMYLIDWAYTKYNIQLSPTHLMTKLYHRIRWSSV